jgi:hypothetical protein
VNEDGRPIKTAWVARFEEFWEANALVFMLTCLLERNRRFSLFNHEASNDATLETFYANGEVEYETDEDVIANEDEEDSEDDNYYHEGGGGDESNLLEEESNKEEVDELHPDIDIATAIRLRRRMAQPEASSDNEDAPSDYEDEDDSEEVAETQNLFQSY